MEQTGINSDSVSVNRLTLVQLSRDLNKLKQHTDVLINSLESASIQCEKIEAEIGSKLQLLTE